MVLQVALGIVLYFILLMEFVCFRFYCEEVFMSMLSMLVTCRWLVMHAGNVTKHVSYWRWW